MDETEIITDIQNGRDRYGELVRRYHVGLIIHCERLVGDRDDAEDIAQGAFVKAYLEIDRFQPGRARFSTWLYRIATNASIDFLRKRKRQIFVDDLESVAAVTMPTHIEDQEKEILRAAVKALKPPEYRKVIEAYYWDGKSYQEIAAAMDVPLNTVRTWLRRAKGLLKEKLS